MADASFDRLIRDAEAAAFAGWDFSWLHGRMVEAPRAWDYADIVRAAFPGVHTVLDIGTGGGERLAAMAPLPPATVATEGYAPNVPVARTRLEPLGVRVVEAADDAPLPFPDASFDLVINRHTGFSTADVHRVLRPGGGRYITQQVGDRHNRDLNAWLGDDTAPSPPPPTLPSLRRDLEAAGLTVTDARECFPPTRVTDIGAVVYYLRAIPWAVPTFEGPATHGAQLRCMHDHIQAHGALQLTSHYLLLQAVKP